MSFSLYRISKRPSPPCQATIFSMLLAALACLMPVPLQATSLTDDEVGFLQAAREGNLNFLANYYETGEDTDIVDGKGRNAAHYAAQGDQGAVIRWCAKHNIALDLQDKEGNTPLLIATSYGHLKAMEALKNESVHIAATSADDLNALHIAILNKDEKTTTWILKHTSLSLNNLGGHPDCTPFALGVFTLDVKWIKFLVKQQGDLQQKIKSCTLVHMILHNYVLQKHQLKASLQEAQQKNLSENKLQPLRKKKEKLLEDTKATIKFLVTEQKSLLEEVETEAGLTPFLVATAYCEIELMQLLLSLDANPKARNKNNKDAYYINGTLLSFAGSQELKEKQEATEELLLKADEEKE